MTSLSTCFALLVTFMIATTSVQADTSSPSLWAKLKISPDTLVSMEHGSFRVDIYEHADNHKENTLPSRHKYFYAPIALLDNKGATSSFNNVTQKAEMRFQIEMWNQEIQNKVVKYLGQVLGRKVNSHQVQIIPLENVILASTFSSTFFTLSTDWKPCRQHKSLWFALSCFDIKDCNQLAANMRSNPEQFDHFKLLFSLSSQTSKTKETTIRIENIVSGQMFNDLLQRFGHDKNVFLTANDEKRLVMETATNIFVESFDDSDVVTQNSESQVYNVLKNLLVSSRTTIKEQSDKMWESVFWNEDNYRPDKTSKTLNEMYSKLDTENQKKMADSYQKSFKVGGKTELNIPGMFSAGGEFNTEFADQGMTSKEDLDKFYNESKDHVVWNGEKFTPKPLALGRINLSRLNDTQSLRDRKVSVRYTTAVLSTPINFVQNAELTTTDEWQILKDQVKEIRERLTFAIANLTALTKNTTETVQRLEQNENHLAQMNTTVLHAIANLTALTTNMTTPSTIGRMPRTCADLRLIGHLRSGIYSVMGNTRIESVYCDFTRQGSNEDKACGGKIFVVDSVVIDIPSLHGDECLWDIQTEDDRILAFTLINERFKDVQDYLTVHDGVGKDSPILQIENQMKYEASNKDLPPAMYTTSSVATLRSRAIRASVLKLKIQKAVPCPYNLGTNTKCGRIVDEISCYCLNDAKLNWEGQLIFCDDNGMKLVSLESYEEEQAILSAWDVLQWSSLSDLRQEGKWVWATTRTPLIPGYQNWGPGQPINPSWLYCMLFPYMTRWHTRLCSGAFSGTCELHP